MNRPAFLMGFLGKLEEFKLSEVLQIIAVNERSGKLSLTRRDAQGVIAFRSGKIIYAASTSARETLGNLLLCDELIEETALLEALETQHQSEEDERLGTILVRQGALDQETLERIVRQQLSKVISEFNDWDTGFFKFESIDFSDQGEIEVEAEDFLLSNGLPTDDLLADIAQRLEALETTTESMSSTPLPAQTPASRSGEELATLKAVMSEIRSPEFTGELTMEILNFAQRVVPRAVLFFARQGTFTGMSQFGVDLPGEGSEERVRSIKIPLDQPSVLAEAAGRKTTFRGPLDPLEWNLYLISKLGGETPGEAIALPLIVNQTVLLVLYGDDAATDRPIESLHELELLMLQAGLAMEKRLLEKRVEQFNKLRGGDEEDED